MSLYSLALHLDFILKMSSLTYTFKNTAGASFGQKLEFGDGCITISQMNGAIARLSIEMKSDCRNPYCANPNCCPRVYTCSYTGTIKQKYLLPTIEPENFRVKKEIPVNFNFAKNDEVKMYLVAYDAITRLGLWKYVKSLNPHTFRMDDENAERILAKILDIDVRSNHNPFSFRYTMLAMADIATNGYSEFKKKYERKTIGTDTSKLEALPSALRQYTVKSDEDKYPNTISRDWAICVTDDYEVVYKGETVFTLKNLRAHSILSYAIFRTHFLNEREEEELKLVNELNYEKGNAVDAHFGSAIAKYDKAYIKIKCLSSSVAMLEVITNDTQVVDTVRYTVKQITEGFVIMDNIVPEGGSVPICYTDKYEVRENGKTIALLTPIRGWEITYNK